MHFFFFFLIIYFFISRVSKLITEIVEVGFCSSTTTPDSTNGIIKIVSRAHVWTACMHLWLATIKEATSDVRTLPTYSRLAGVGVACHRVTESTLTMSCYKISAEFSNKVRGTEETYTETAWDMQSPAYLVSAMPLIITPRFSYVSGRRIWKLHQELLTNRFFSTRKCFFFF